MRSSDNQDGEFGVAAIDCRGRGNGTGGKRKTALKVLNLICAQGDGIVAWR